MHLYSSTNDAAPRLRPSNESRNRPVPDGILLPPDSTTDGCRCAEVFTELEPVNTRIERYHNEAGLRD